MKTCIALVLLFMATGARAGSAPAGSDSTRTQLSLGYSLLYQEAGGIPKLKWLLALKKKDAGAERSFSELADYYRQLADEMKHLSQRYPAMRVDMDPLPQIEADTRKAIGEDYARDFAPLVGKGGTEFEREALLMFEDSLNEQRHLVGVMLDRESEPALQGFLRKTKEQLDSRHRKIAELLRRRYFRP